MNVKQCQTINPKGGCANCNANPLTDARTCKQSSKGGRSFYVVDGCTFDADGHSNDGRRREISRMNCNRCPHMRAIQKALAPCQTCDAGKMHGQVSTDAAKTPDLVLAHRKMSDHTPSSGVTALDPTAEDALRKAMATLFALDPVELLLVQHVIKGGSYANFCDVLWPMLRRLRTKEKELLHKKDGFRSLSHTWAKKIEEKMPQMRDVLRARIELT